MTTNIGSSAAAGTTGAFLLSATSISATVAVAQTPLPVPPPTADAPVLQQTRINQLVAEVESQLNRLRPNQGIISRPREITSACQTLRPMLQECSGHQLAVTAFTYSASHGLYDEGDTYGFARNALEELLKNNGAKLFTCSSEDIFRILSCARHIESNEFRYPLSRGKILDTLAGQPNILNNFRNAEIAELVRELKTVVIPTRFYDLLKARLLTPGCLTYLCTTNTPTVEALLELINSNASAVERQDGSPTSLFGQVIAELVSTGTPRDTFQSCDLRLLGNFVDRFQVAMNGQNAFVARIQQVLRAQLDSGCQIQNGFTVDQFINILPRSDALIASLEGIKRVITGPTSGNRTILINPTISHQAPHQSAPARSSSSAAPDIRVNSTIRPVLIGMQKLSLR